MVQRAKLGGIYTHIVNWSWWVGGQDLCIVKEEFSSGDGGCVMDGHQEGREGGVKQRI